MVGSKSEKLVGRNAYIWFEGNHGTGVGSYHDTVVGDEVEDAVKMPTMEAASQQSEFCQLQLPHLHLHHPPVHNHHHQYHHHH